MKIIRIESKEDLKKLIKEKIEQLDLFGDAEAVKRAEKKEKQKKNRSEASKKAAETKRANKEKKNKQIEKDFNIARSVGKDLFGNEISDEERKEAEERLRKNLPKKKEKK